MKVLFVTNSAAMGGDSVALLHLLKPLQTMAVEIFVTYPRESMFSERLQTMGIKGGAIDAPLDIYPPLRSLVDYLKLPVRIYKYLKQRKRATSRLESFIKEFQPDIIHTNVGPLHIGYQLATKYHIPHIWHIREYQKEDFGMRPFPSMSIFLKRIHDDSNHCICITRDVFNHFKLDNDKDYVIYDGVIDKSKRKAINEHKSDYILFVGRLEEAKGIMTLIKAYNGYIEQGGHLKLLVAGKGKEDYTESCRSHLSDKARNNVIFLGQRSDVYELMYNAKIFVVPSKREGFGFITVESMFNGTLVIGHNTGGTKEQFDNAFKEIGHEVAFRYSMESEIVTLLNQIETMSDDMYNSLASKAQDVVCKLYDIESQSVKLLNVYKKIIHK